MAKGKDLISVSSTGKRHKKPPPGSTPVYRDGIQLLRENHLNDPLGQTPSIQAEDTKAIKGTMGDFILGTVFSGDGSSMLMENMGPFVPSGASDIMARRFRSVRSQEDVERAYDGDDGLDGDIVSSDTPASSEGPSEPGKWIMQILKLEDDGARGLTIIANGTVVPVMGSMWIAILDTRGASDLEALVPGTRFGMIPSSASDGVQATKADLLLFTVLASVGLDDGRVSFTLDGGRPQQ